MTQDRNVEYPDINQLLDDELFFESQYLGEQIASLTDEIRLRSLLIGQGWKETGSTMELSTRKIVADLHFSISRQQAITDEMAYRAEMMR